MNLSHLLSNLPHEQLQLLADEYGVSVLTPSRRSLIQSINIRYRDRHFMAGILAGLPHTCSGLLRALVFFTDTKKPTILIPPALEQAWCYKIPLEEQLSILYEKGLLFKGNSDQRNSVILPDEIRRLLRSLFLSQFQALQPIEYRELSHVHYREPIIEAVYHLLCLLQRTRAKLTQKGEMHKKTLERWEQRMGDPGHSKDIFDFSFDYCRDNELMNENQNKLSTSKKAHQWFKRPLYEIHQDLWSYLIEHRILMDTSFQKVLIILFSAEKALNESTQMPIFRGQDIETEFNRHTRSNELLSSPSINSPKEVMDILVSLGFMHMEMKDDGWVFHFTPTGLRTFFNIKPQPDEQEAQRPKCILQPSFQLLVPPNVDYETLWMLDQIAEFRQRDVMTEFQITQKSIVHAMRMGWTQEKIDSLLDNITDKDIPDNVRYSMAEWCGKYGQIKLFRAVLLECVNRELADEIQHIPEVHELLSERIAERYFLILESKAREIINVLQDRGYEPSVSIKLTTE